MFLSSACGRLAVYIYIQGSDDVKQFLYMSKYWSSFKLHLFTGLSKYSNNFCLQVQLALDNCSNSGLAQAELEV